MKEILKKMEEAFGEKQDKILELIQYYAKLRILILNRMKDMKLIPQEMVDKYNETVRRVRSFVAEAKSGDDDDDDD